MAMDFFERQARARRRTGLLLFYFFIAVFLIVAAFNAIAWLFTGALAQPRLPVGAWLHLPYWRWITVAVLLVIFTGSLVRYLSLRSGGHVIAQSVHARRILPNTVDAKERMLLNVVEEMAIASGTPMPTVWIMDDEPGINAFVAGFEPTRAVLVMTRGALETFDREELQGVVGHEFSHILNGDMRLNVQLYAILAGILLIGSIGEFLMRSSGRVARDSDDIRAVPIILVAGTALMVIGYAGLFCGRLIKAAISRQREYLADASSVQFTRNPQGIGEALLAIRNAADGSLLQNIHAEDMSHMCIALPVTMAFSGLLATHPPLEARIRAIDPSLLARDRARSRSAQRAGTGAVAPGAAGFAGDAGTSPVAARPDDGIAAAALIASIGHPASEHHARALRLRDSLPPLLRDLLQREDGARGALYGLLVADMPVAHEEGALRIVGETDDDAALAARVLLPSLRGLGTRLRLPCHDLALPALRAMPELRKTAFLATLQRLVDLDGRRSLREYLTLSLMRKYLAPGAGRRRPVRHRSYRSVGEPLNVVLSLLCHHAGGSAAGRADLHARLFRSFGTGDAALLPADELDADRLHDALQELVDLAPLLKKPLLDACVDAVRHDSRVQVAEIELLRAVGEALDCPVPPLVG
ncbi:MAG: M48 family metallopeptidase [Pseudomonadota bacterium]